MAPSSVLLDCALDDCDGVVEKYKEGRIMLTKEPSLKQFRRVQL